MSASGCGCCACAGGAAWASVANRPGLSVLRHRVGTHATFLEQMIGRLSRPASAMLDPSTPWKPYSLSRLTTRQADDPAVALLDAWATAADVLTFYQERFVNEGYLRTATERRSIVELARLVGYAPRPGVSATVYVAYSIDDGAVAHIEAGAKVQSIPGPDEQPQTFETSDDLDARGEWNNLAPRMEQPQAITAALPTTIYIAGTANDLHAGDTLLFVFPGTTETRITSRILSATADYSANRTAVQLQHLPSILLLTLNLFLGFGFPIPINIPPSRPPANKADLGVTFETTFSKNSDTVAQLFDDFFPNINMYAALAGLQSQTKPPVRIYAMRKTFAVFGYNAPEQLVKITNGEAAGSDPAPPPNESTKVVFLDTAADSIHGDTYAVIRNHGFDTVAMIANADTRPHTANGISGKSTRLELDVDWRSAAADYTPYRETAILAESQELTLANMPLTDPIGAPETKDDTGPTTTGSTNQPQPKFDPATMIDLGRLYAGLKAGRWIVITGERLDVANSTGVLGSELAMIAHVEQRVDVPLFGDWAQTRLHLAAPLAYRYKRDTVVIRGNVVKATHGETRVEVLGSGDATQALQTFTLHHTPLTFVPAPTPEGTKTTLEVRINDVLWHESPALSFLGASDRGYVTKIADDQKASVIFGTGTNGARLPSGSDNVRAKYRSGIGDGGNVKAGQVATAITRPLGVKDVVNPLPASGGADPESADQARRNVPVAVRALGRIISVRDYEDFARTFAGIGKAMAVNLTDGARRVVHLTIAGAADIDVTSDLYRNLVEALTKYGDPHVPVIVQPREAVFLGGEAKVRIHSGYLWSAVFPQIRAALLDAFAFDRRELGQPLFASEVTAAIQSVPGVIAVDLDRLLGVSLDLLTATPDAGTNLPPLPPAVTIWPPPLIANVASFDTAGAAHPAQIIYANPKVPELFSLAEVPR